jgi:serine/threonine-protein kinase Stk1
MIPHAAPSEPQADPVLLGMFGETDVVSPGRLIDDRWLVVRPLSRGSQCLAFELRDTAEAERPSQSVLKVLRPALADNPASLAFLDNERRILEHLGEMDGVVKLLGTHAVGGTASALRLSLAPGRPLGQLLAESGEASPLPPQRVRVFLLKLADTLARLHERGIVHGDLKPSNVMVAPDDSPTLLDFGAGRATADNDALGLPDLDAIAVTPAWASPAQTAGRPPDEAGDVSSLALLIARLITGRHPFDGRPPAEAIEAGRHAHPVRGVGRRLRAMLERILDTADAQPVGASELASALRHAWSLP